MNRTSPMKSLKGITKGKLNVHSIDLNGVNHAQLILDQESMKILHCDFQWIAHYYPKAPKLDESANIYHILQGQLYIRSAQGTMVLDRGETFTVDHREEDFLVYGNRSAQALNITSPSSFKRIQKNTVDLTQFIDQIDQKDHYTLNHSMRVAQYAFLLGLELELSNYNLYLLRLAAKFHDIGKVKVPDSILQKKDTFTPEEYQIMKEHSQWGAEILSASQMLGNDEIVKTVAQHHERIDGTGYPRGLTKDDICQDAKILAIADCYDAMTTTRIYKKAVPHDAALEELQREAGKSLDQELCRRFIEMTRKNNIFHSV